MWPAQMHPASVHLFFKTYPPVRSSWQFQGRRVARAVSMVEMKTLAIDKNKCPALENRWACSKCRNLIGVIFDMLLAADGEMRVVEDSDLTCRHGRDRSEKSFLEQAVRECPEKALSWN
jgi:ferredoxin